jgi:8-oxo-dGTP pyrophosphatase MutT (NUDIX family)
VPAGESWAPSRQLVDDARRSIRGAVLSGPQDRFESAAWCALLADVGPGLLTRDAAPSHVTASGIVLSGDGAATCLVLHGRIGLWVQPGGHLEPGDDSLAAGALREVLEETGLSARVAGPVVLSRHRAPCAPGRVDWHLDVQYVVLAGREPPTVSPESRDVAWWDVDQLAGLEDAGRLTWGLRGTVERALTSIS